MLWLYYASLKSDEILLITANTVGCVVETIYIAIYIAFAPKQARVLNKTLSLSLSLYIYIVIGFWYVHLLQLEPYISLSR